MGGGNQMILVGVQMSTLPPGWIFFSRARSGLSGPPHIELNAPPP